MNVTTSPPFLILGANGRLGRALATCLADQEVVALTRQELDITDEARVAAYFERFTPRTVINAAAYNAVDLAEHHPDEAYRVNALGPRNLAAACERIGATLAHVSSDYVFGSDHQRQTPYRETDLPGPESVYGVSKLAGEYFVLANCSRSFVIRTCGLYGGLEAGKQSFVEKILRAAASGKPLRVVADQRCTPTLVSDLAPTILSLLQTDQHGLYHATNSDHCTWLEFAEEALRISGIRARVEPISSESLKLAARRPHFSVLDCEKLTTAIGRAMPDWRSALAKNARSRSTQ